MTQHAGAKPVRRGWAGAAVAAAGLAALTLLLAPTGTALSLASVGLLYLVPVVAAAVIGGVRPALAAAIPAVLLVNFFYIPPYHTLVVESRDQVIVLVVYVGVAAAASVAVEVAAGNGPTVALLESSPTGEHAVAAQHRPRRPAPCRARW